jgi:DNA-binding XRE family transcriptional regulator
VPTGHNRVCTDRMTDSVSEAEPGPAPMPEISGLGARLRERRRRSGLTLEAAAARVGLSPAYLSRLETERRQPSLPVLLGLSRAGAG